MSLPENHAPDDPATPARLWPLAVWAALLAGLTAWLIGQSKDPVFVPPVRLVSVRGVMTDLPTFEQKTLASRKNAALATGVLGASLGFWMGLAGGLARGSGRSGLKASAAGLVLGGVLGAVASSAAVPFYFRRLDTSAEELSRDLTLPLAVHALSWSAVGAAGGVAFALGLGVTRRLGLALVGGLAGGAVGAGIYEIVGATAFPNGRTSEPLAPDWGPRLLATLAVSLLTAVLVVCALRSRARPTRGVVPRPVA